VDRQYSDSLDTSGRDRRFSDSLGTSADDLLTSEISNDPRALGIMAEGSEEEEEDGDDQEDGSEEGEGRAGARVARAGPGSSRDGPVERVDSGEVGAGGEGSGVYRSPHRSVASGRSGASGRVGAGAAGFQTPSAHYFVANDTSMTVKRRRRTPQA
jgi:hypothetical protein